MCWGPFKRICHWGPLFALGIIKLVTMCTVACLSRWWPPWETMGGSLIFISFMSSAIFSLYFFMQAMFTGPGVLSKDWKPLNETDQVFLQFCTVCQAFKAPRAHHCRKCGTCNMKMDHHCPWINNCVGHKNHGSFTLFLFFSVVGCAQGAFVLGCTIYRALNMDKHYLLHAQRTHQPIIVMTLWGFVLYMFVLGTAIGVVVAVGMLLYFQIRGILRNRTGIEDWILNKAIHRRGPTDPPYVYPYDLGRFKNFVQVINIWCEPVGDGIWWPVRQGCHQYTLTIEQLSQKAEKRARSREYIITEKFSGWWFPCSKGPCVCLHPPCTDEARIPLDVGDTVMVTRWKKYWLYGERIHEEHELEHKNKGKNIKNRRHRGWFPRRCAVEVLSTQIHQENIEIFNENFKFALDSKSITSSPSSTPHQGNLKLNAHCQDEIEMMERLDAGPDAFSNSSSFYQTDSSLSQDGSRPRKNKKKRTKKHEESFEDKKNS